MSMLDKAKSVTVVKKAPVWSGPEGTGINGGITFSMLSKWLNCKERFRALVVEGLKPVEKFSHRIEYGNLFHLAEETYQAGHDWRQAIHAYAEKLCFKYPFSQDEVDKWYNVCLVQFPVYLLYWQKHHEGRRVTPLLQEQVFDVPYKLPSGRVVRLRGKWDAVELMDEGVYLGEHKTKGDPDEVQIQRQLTFDLQTMLYLVALRDYAFPERVRGYGAIKGVRYNVVRRPLSGGKGTIVQKKGSKNIPAETKEEYYSRLQQYITEEPETYFFRWTTEVTAGDIERFKQKCLDPMLTSLCMWWDHILYTLGKGEPPFFCSPPPDNDVSLHWQHPFGVPNYIDDGGYSDMDAYLESGSTVGLRVVDNLFPELGGE